MEINMIKMQGKLPKTVVVGCSGGPDSMAIVDFLKNNHKVMLHFVHHGTDASDEAMEFLYHYKSNNDVGFVMTKIDTVVPKRMSQEEHWRYERYSAFYTWNIPVITAHHLDDCVETWIFSSLHGEGKVIPYRNRNVIRPFRLNRKSEFIEWCSRKNVDYVHDKSNDDQRYMRNYIRHSLIPMTLKVNPGIHKTIGKKISKENVF